MYYTLYQTASSLDNYPIKTPSTPAAGPDHPNKEGAWWVGGAWQSAAVPPFKGVIGECAGKRDLPRQPRNDGPRILPLTQRRILHDFELDLLDFRQPLPLPRQDMIDLFVQVPNLKLGFQVHPEIVLRP